MFCLLSSRSNQRTFPSLPSNPASQPLPSSLSRTRRAACPPWGGEAATCRPSSSGLNGAPRQWRAGKEAAGSCSLTGNRCRIMSLDPHVGLPRQPCSGLLAYVKVPRVACCALIIVISKESFTLRSPSSLWLGKFHILASFDKKAHSVIRCVCPFPTRCQLTTTEL